MEERKRESESQREASDLLRIVVGSRLLGQEPGIFTPVLVDSVLLHHTNGWGEGFSFTSADHIPHSCHFIKHVSFKVQHYFMYCKGKKEMLPI